MNNDNWEYFFLTTEFSFASKSLAGPTSVHLLNADRVKNHQHMRQEK